MITIRELPVTPENILILLMYYMSHPALQEMLRFNILISTATAPALNVAVFSEKLENLPTNPVPGQQVFLMSIEANRKTSMCTANDGAYHPFTTRFDQIIDVRSGNFDQSVDWRKLRLRLRQYGAETQNLRLAVEAVSAVMLNGLNPRCRAASDNTAVTLLLDHSGSLNKEKRTSTALAVVDSISTILCRLNLPVEILGFTTDSWHGGQSRKEWIKKGRPENPGRLCDLLHLIYRTHDDREMFEVKNLRHFLREELLKENIDGEALAWAEARLKQRPEDNKILIQISDGAPADSATVLANTPSYLVDHHRDVIKSIEGSAEVDLYGIGLGYDVDQYFAQSIRIDRLDGLCGVVAPFMEHVLSPQHSLSPG